MNDISIPMVRPVFLDKEFHINKWKDKDITIVIPQRKTKDLTRLCVESILRFYPDVPILLIDGNSMDDSVFYLRFMALKHRNIKVWERPNKEGFSSHGDTLHEAIVNHVKTKYILTMDSDTIVERGGWIEEMLSMYSNTNLYAIGTLMLVSREGHACKPPIDETDVLRYAHPSCSIYDKEKYLNICNTTTNIEGKIIQNRFWNHGAPCVYSMLGAEMLGYEIGSYPINKYVSHLSGASWQHIPTIFEDDHDVKLRPFITFISQGNKGIINQSDCDFDIVSTNTEFWDGSVVMHSSIPTDISSNILYPIRFNICGEYVCKLPLQLEYKFVAELKNLVINLAMPDELDIYGIKVMKRELWQKKYCFI